MTGKLPKAAAVWKIALAKAQVFGQNFVRFFYQSILRPCRRKISHICCASFQILFIRSSPANFIESLFLNLHQRKLRNAIPLPSRTSSQFHYSATTTSDDKKNLKIWENVTNLPDIYLKIRFYLKRPKFSMKTL